MFAITVLKTARYSTDTHPVGDKLETCVKKFQEIKGKVKVLPSQSAERCCLPIKKKVGREECDHSRDQANFPSAGTIASPN